MTCARSRLSCGNAQSAFPKIWASSMTPTCRPREAGACDAKTAATTAIAAAVTAQSLDTDWFPSERREHARKTLLEVDLRLPAEHLTGPGDVRLPHLGVVHRQGLEHDLAARPRHANDRF